MKLSCSLLLRLVTTALFQKSLLSQIIIPRLVRFRVINSMAYQQLVKIFQCLLIHYPSIKKRHEDLVLSSTSIFFFPIFCALFFICQILEIINSWIHKKYQINKWSRPMVNNLRKWGSHRNLTCPVLPINESKLELSMLKITSILLIWVA